MEDKKKYHLKKIWSPNQKIYHIVLTYEALTHAAEFMLDHTAKQLNLELKEIHGSGIVDAKAH